MNNPLVVFLLLNIFNTAIMIEKTILYIKVILSILYGYPNFEIKKILRFLSRFGADGRNRTGTGFRSRRILSPVRLPVPPHLHFYWQSVFQLTSDIIQFKF